MIHPTSIRISPSCSIAVSGPVLLQHWFGDITLADVDATLIGHQRANGRATHGVFVLAVLDGIPGLPAEETRHHIASMATKNASEVAAHATVFRSSGFSGSALRSVMTAIFSLARTSYPRRVFANVPDACRWLATFDGAPEASTLITAFGRTAREAQSA